jgi:glutamyl-tRNA synthetase
LRQTEHFDIYSGYIGKLLEEGKAYHCYCSAEELEERRQEAMKSGNPVSYDRRCRGRTGPVEGITPSVRFKMPIEGSVEFLDMIKGAVSFDNTQVDDLIIRRSDGTPTYNFVVVVDDMDMGITHVIRGDDHLNNTPKQLHIYKALGYEVPVFAHLPMILGSDKARLSKRHGATSVIAYRDEGYLPDALINYLVRLGWSHGDQEVFTRQELVELFSFDRVGKAAAVFNPEKLIWLNAEYMKSTPPEKLAEIVMPFLIKNGTIKEGNTSDKELMLKAIPQLVERSKTLVELAAQLRYFLSDEYETDDKAANKFLKPEIKKPLAALKENLLSTSFTHDEIESAFKETTQEYGLKLKNLAQPVRVSLTGGTASPGIFDLIEILGKDRTSARLERTLNSIADPEDGQE